MLDWTKSVRAVLGKWKRSSRSLFWSCIGLFSRPGPLAPIDHEGTVKPTEVDEYWGEHTVTKFPFKSAWQSSRYVQWRFREYPLFRELMSLYGNHAGEVVVDYGCGPGNDLVGFASSSARQVIGVDISRKALTYAAQRLAIHHIDPAKVRLIQVVDSSPSIPLSDASVDFIYSGGVIHHTTDPLGIICEFHRVLKPGSSATVMVYNYDSVYLRLCTAYGMQVVNGEYPGLDARAAFERHADRDAGGDECPIARCYTEDEFGALCRQAGFDCDYKGGYFSRVELSAVKKHLQDAVADERLPEEHRASLKALSTDSTGFPRYQAKYAGLGGVYWLRKEQ